jgi:hypothetical protein
MPSRRRAASLIRPLLLAAFAVALVFRVGPFCEAASAAPVVEVVMSDCHGHFPAPERPKPAEMICLTPCAVLAPEVAPVVSIGLARRAPTAATLPALAGFSVPPDDPPPRLG